MTKITLREDCGNSPKNLFVQNLTVAFVTGDVDLIRQSVSEDVYWKVVGIAPIVGKSAVIAVFSNPNRETTTELFVDQVVTHGKAGAVNGTFRLSGGKKKMPSHSTNSVMSTNLPMPKEQVWRRLRPM